MGDLMDTWTFPAALTEARTYSRLLRAEARHNRRCFPQAALAPHLDERCGHMSRRGGQAPTLSSVLQTVVKVDRKTAYRWLLDEFWPYDRADRVSCALGLHPSLVWGDWYDMDLAV